MKRLKGLFAAIIAVCLVCGVGTPMGNSDRGAYCLTAYAAATDQKLAVPVEFKKVSEDKAWDKSHTTLGMEYTDNVHTLTSGTTLSYDVYIPQNLWKKGAKNLYVSGGLDFTNPDNDYWWFGGANSTIELCISKKALRTFPFQFQ